MSDITTSDSKILSDEFVEILAGRRIFSFLKKRITEIFSYLHVWKKATLHRILTQ